MATQEVPPRSLAFDAEKDLAWRVSLPRGASSPCIQGERIFLTGAEGDELLMLAFERKTGAELWRRGRKTRPPVPAAHVDVDPAAPTPCTDGERVVFYFGTHGLVVLDRSGELLWEKPLPFPKTAFGIGTSPILVDDLVILARDGCPDSAVHAYSKVDGTERWSVPRLGFGPSFGTPFVWNIAQDSAQHSAQDGSARRELVLAGTRRLIALDSRNGKPLWEVAGLTSVICTTPTADAETLYFAAWSTGDAEPTERGAATFGELELSAEELEDSRILLARLDASGDGRLARDEFPVSRAKDGFVFLDQDGDGFVSGDELARVVERPKGPADNLLVAVAAGGTGDIPRSALRWSHARGLPYVSSPLLYRGRLYLVSSGGMVTCLDAKTGKPFFDRERLADRGEYYATPVGTDGHVIVCSSTGTISVLRAANEFRLERSVALGEAIHATPAIVDGTIYLRTEKSLWAFGK
jgi:outer membrane protein assembly factor BamB